ncbi:MAG: thioesterase family protein [Simkaniaceae bacterium]|nr:thioesterase family protein [Simkaniaceae bacterium]
MDDTDGTGAVYFADRLRFASEAFEEFLHLSDFPFAEMMTEKGMLLPVVHIEADFLLPLRWGDRITVGLHLADMGTTSFSYRSDMHREEEFVGTVLIVHVMCRPSSSGTVPTPIPDEIRVALDRLRLHEPGSCR